MQAEYREQTAGVLSRRKSVLDAKSKKRATKAKKSVFEAAKSKAKQHWTSEEMEGFLYAATKHGNKPKEIAAELGSRSTE